jgi:hypothetical protein
MTDYHYNTLSLTKPQASFLLECIRYTDQNYPRVTMEAMEQYGPDLVRALQEIVGGE